MFDVSKYKENLKTKIFGRNIVVLDTVGSTNDDISAFYEYNGLVLLANRQLKGRGRMGKTWHSNDKGNLYFSYIINNLKITDITSVALFVSFSLYDVLKKFGPFKIKWPNDIVISKRKVAGILIETKVLDNQLLYAVVGVGINVNSKKFPEEISNLATSIFSVYKNEISKEELLANFFNTFEFYLLTYLKSNIKINIVEKWSQASEYINKLIKIKTAERVEEVIERGIDEDGALIVESMAGNKKKLYYGDILDANGC